MNDAADAALRARIREVFEARDRSDMQPTIDAFLGMLAEHPGDAEVVYEVGGAYDTAGEEATALGYYETALELGLDGELRRKCLLQYGSTLRNLGRLDDSLAVFARARREFPHSEALRVFEALSLHAAGRSDGAVAALIELVVDRIDSPELRRHDPSGHAAYLAARDAARGATRG